MNIRMILVSIYVMACTLIAAGPARAQAPDCAPPCDISTAQWLDANAHIFMCDRFGCCDFDVTYRYRTGCDFFDLEVTLVDNPANCLGQVVDLGRLINGAVDWLLRNDPMGFPPFDKGDCQNNIRIFKASCWIFNVEQAALLPCGSSCCNETFRICIDQSGNRQVVQTGGVTTVTTCTPGSGCYSACREYTGEVER